MADPSILNTMKKTINPETHAVEIPAGYRLLGRTVQIKPGDYFTTPASDEWTLTKNDGTTKRNPFSTRAYIRPVPKLKLFCVASVSENPNAFGLHGHVLVAADGEAWEVARSRGGWLTPWNKGAMLAVELDSAGEPMWLGKCEIPRRLADCPAEVRKELFP